MPGSAGVEWIDVHLRIPGENYLLGWGKKSWQHPPFRPSVGIVLYGLKAKKKWVIEKTLKKFFTQIIQIYVTHLLI
jgi:hypothetical protein